MKKPTHLALRIQNTIFYLLFVLIIGLLGYLGKTYHKSFDVTENQRNSLHQTTQDLLKKITKPIKLVAYVPDDAVVHTALKDLIEKYRKYHKAIELEFVNPDLDPVRAQQDGIEYSGQLLIKLGDKSEAVSSVDEQTMINVLQRLSREKARLLIFLEGHNEASPLEDKSNGLSKLETVLEKKGFLLQPHNILRTQSIPENTSFVVIAAPQKDYLEAEVKIILDYMSRGGNLLWLHEPGGLHGLDDLEQQLGLELQQGTLLDANQALQEMLGIKHPAAIAVIDYGQSELTKDLSAHTLFPFATSINKDEAIKDSNWKYQPILSTLITSWLESGDIQGNVKFDDDADKPGPLDIGMILTREIPESDATENNPVDKPAKKNTEQRVVVLGDSDFMQNSYIGQGSNLDFASNIFNWLSTDDDLLSIKSSIAPGNDLSLTNTGRVALAALWLVLPLVLMVLGLFRWMRRRKR
jgi:ABC-type uncharacterized transport system involved in gliding motility auxiliary subunit